MSLFAVGLLFFLQHPASVLFWRHSRSVLKYPAEIELAVESGKFRYLPDQVFVGLQHFLGFLQPDIRQEFIIGALAAVFKNPAQIWLADPKPVADRQNTVVPA